MGICYRGALLTNTVIPALPEVRDHSISAGSLCIDITKPGYLTVHDSLSQDDSAGPRRVMHSEVFWPWCQLLKKLLYLYFQVTPPKGSNNSNKPVNTRSINSNSYNNTDEDYTDSVQNGGLSGGLNGGLNGDGLTLSVDIVKGNVICLRIYCGRYVVKW